MKNTKQIALLKLFNAVEIDGDSVEKEIPYNTFYKMVSNGYIMDSRVYPSYQLMKDVEELVGIGGEKLNSSFHKSWGKVSSASMFQLVVEQMLHYLTTYGFELLYGTYDSKLVYFPSEKLYIPEVNESIPLVFIKAMTSSEILDEIVKIGSSGIALSKETISDIMTVVENSEFDSDFVEEISNRELFVKLCSFYDIVPSEPVQYLRYLVSKLTGETLLIKNKNLVNKILTSDGNILDELLLESPHNLSSIFFRFKPLFLAMKKISYNKSFFNRLRKDAEFNHVPLGRDYLNSVTSQIKDGSFRISEFRKVIQSYPVWRKIRLAYALNNRLTNNDGSIVYRIRNGKGWVDNFDVSGNKTKTLSVLNETLESIAGDISDKVSGKVFYIPENVHYALPSTEKQFVGNVPSNTYVSIKDNLIVGVHWYNHENKSGYNNGRVDIDFSMIDMQGKYGWDGSYRNQERSVLFSGDVTDAPRPNGATELFYMKNGLTSGKLMYANYFNYDEKNPVDVMFFVATEEINSRLDRNYMVNPSNIIFSQLFTTDVKQTNIGFIIGDGKETRVFVSNVSVGNSISVRRNEFTGKMIDFSVSTAINPIQMKDVLELAGGIVVHEKPEEGDFVNLSPEALDKGSFINLFKQ